MPACEIDPRIINLADRLWILIEFADPLLARIASAILLGAIDLRQETRCRSGDSYERYPVGAGDQVHGLIALIDARRAKIGPHDIIVQHHMSEDRFGRFVQMVCVERSSPYRGIQRP